MKRCLIAMALALCVLTVFLTAGCSGCAGDNGDEPKEELNYSDDYQAVAQVDYDTLTVQVRTSSSAYFSGSVISVTAVIENKSENYFCVSPEGNGFELSVSADGYDLIPSGLISPSDAVMVLEPNGSVSMTREYKSKVMIDGEERNLWECEPVATVSVKMSEPAVSRQAALDMPFSETKTAKTSFMMYGTGDRP